MNIALLAKKGGVGKSTLSILLYEALRAAGKTVVIRDWDAQGTSSKALELIGNGNSPPPADANLAEVLLYDTPPNLDHTATAAAVRDADIALVITTPSPADVWEAEEAVNFVTTRNPDAIVRVVFNKVKKSTILGRLAENVGETPYQALTARLSSRECYQHAIAQGWKALDGAAREEVLQLGLAVLSLRK
ncbi:MAG: ParA family protein [Acidobacteriota bacterium]